MVKDEKISTGSHDLNAWIGGYEKDVITMIAGSPGSGKTNFVLLASCSQAKKGNKVIFIDTEGGFSIERVKQIGGENTEEILKNILLLSPTNFDEQKKAFSQILDKLKKNQVNLIVVDGMATLYRLGFGDIKDKEENIKELNWKMAEQMRMVAEISRKQDIPVIVTHPVYSG